MCTGVSEYDHVYVCVCVSVWIPTNQNDSRTIWTMCVSTDAKVHTTHHNMKGVRECQHKPFLVFIMVWVYFNSRDIFMESKRLHQVTGVFLSSSDSSAQYNAINTIKNAQVE